MRVPNRNARLARPVSCVEKECGVKIETVLRIRPLLKNERDDPILLEERKTQESNDAQVAILKEPTSSGDRNEYCFNHVLPESTNQDKIYYTLGLPIVTATMNSLKNQSSSKIGKSHLLVSLGMENSGKTYTCLGGLTIPKRRASQDGLVPRLLDSLFSQSSHAGSRSKAFSVQISMIQVTQLHKGQRSDLDPSQINDLLANPGSSSKSRVLGASPKKKKNLNVRNMAARFERAIPSPVGRRQRNIPDNGSVLLEPENLKPTIRTCHDISQARELLQTGLQASQKLTMESQKRHLYISMQPVVDGTKKGDKICVLDMSGLDKENVVQSTSGKGACYSNQAANDAILKYLKTLKEYPNTLNSENCRHHKVTMLLNPIFRSNSSVEVTLIVTAYPGHVDFQQKKLLLEDVQMLFDEKLSGYRSTQVHDKSSQQIKPGVSARNNQHQHDRKAVNISSYRRNEGSDVNSKKEARNSSKSVQVLSNTLRLPKPESLKNSRSEFLSVEPRMPTESFDIPQDISTILRKERDRSLMVGRNTNEQRVDHLVGDASEIHEPYMDSGKLNECVVDFPGLQITPSKEENGDRACYSIANNQSRRATARERRTSRVRTEHPSNTRKENTGRLDTKRSNLKTKGEFKSALGIPNIENSENSVTDQIRGTYDDDQYTLEKTKTISNSFKADFSKFQGNVEHENGGQTRTLEEKLKETLQEKRSLEQICLQLEKENAELKQLSLKTGRKSMKLHPTDEEEEEFLANKKLRLEAQNKIKAPIHEHLERVNYIYEIKNQWCMTNKKHFSLSFPEHFQRAPVLDIRDKRNEEVKGMNDLTKKENHINGGDSKKKNLKDMRKSLVRPSQTHSPNPSRSPNGLSALRRLAGKTHKG